MLDYLLDPRFRLADLAMTQLRRALASSAHYYAESGKVLMAWGRQPNYPSPVRTKKGVDGHSGLQHLCRQPA